MQKGGAGAEVFVKQLTEKAEKKIQLILWAEFNLHGGLHGPK